MAFTTAPLNAYEPFVDEKRRPTKTALEWLTSLIGDVDASPSTFSPVALVNQSASISATAIPTESLSEGLYRVSYHAYLTQAATTNSSLTVTLTWTNGAIAFSFSGAAMTGNLTTTMQSGTQLVRIDAATPVSYSTTYSSTGATAMKYGLDVVLEQVRA